jgi:predicted transcriptional regulator
MADPNAPFGSTEIEILRYIGDHHPISVGEMAEHVAQTTGQARTTVLTIMERLRQKGHLTRKKAMGVYRYSPKVANQILLRTLVKNFVDTTLGGSISPFVAFLSESGPVSADDLEMLKQLVRDLEGQRKGGQR